MCTISITSLTKKYQIYSSSIDRLKEALHPAKKIYHKEFVALNNISLDVLKGESLGLIGLNGSGKSTLLKIICGVTQATSGSVQVNGRISALLELGAGFNPELTGRQNIFFVGAVQGVGRETMKARCASAIEFADIGDFIDQPVKNYSSGMLVRLAFSIAVHVDPDILVVDEALAVGDVRFQHKCLNIMSQFKQRCTVLYVSHDLSSVLTFCDRVAWLHKGKLIEIGDPKEVIDHYTEATYQGVENLHEFTEVKRETSECAEGLSYAFNDSDGFGTKSATITNAQLVDEADKPVFLAKPGKQLRLQIHIDVAERIARPIVGFLVKNGLGLIVFGFNTEQNSLARLEPLEAGERKIVSLSFSWPAIQGGTYSITIGIAEGTTSEHVQHHLIPNALIVESEQQSDFSGMIDVSKKRCDIYEV